MAGIATKRAIWLVLAVLATAGAGPATAGADHLPLQTPFNAPSTTNSSATAPVCEPTACMILDVGAGYNKKKTDAKHCRRDDNCCAPAERAACAPGYRYSRGEPCDGDGRCGDHAVCCTRCLPGEACAEKSEDFGRAVRCDVAGLLAGTRRFL